MTAPYPSVQRIEQNKPVFNAMTEQEAQRIRVYPSISSGALEFAQCAFKTFGAIPTLFTAELLTKWINVFCSIYTEKDKEEFKHIQHAWDAEHTNWLPIPRRWFEGEYENRSVDETDIKLFGIPFFTIKQTENIKRFYLFRVIPFLRIKRRPNRQNIYLYQTDLSRIV